MMVYKLELKDTHYQVIINSDVEISLNSRIINELIINLDLLSTAINGGLKELECIRTNGICNYSFETNNGRTWNQQIIFSQYPDLDPRQTFNVTDQFTLKEFNPHRIIRDIVIRLVNEYKMKDIKIEVS